MKKIKRFLSLLLAIVLCLSTPVTSFAAEQEPPVDEKIIYEDMGWNQGGGTLNGSFNVYLPSGSSSSTGQITVRITSANQNTPVYLYVTDPNGRIVWNRAGVDPFTGMFPNNGNEQYSPTFSGAIAGNYTVHWSYFGDYMNINCWVYNW